MIDDLDPDAIEATRRGVFGRPLEIHDEIDSTNRRALEWAASGAPEGAVVVADHQSAGRGRRGRVWRSAPGGSLLFSLVLRRPVVFEAPGVTTTALGVAVAEAVDDLAGITAGLKWPNDVLVDGRKLAGILVETTGGDTAVAGVGINVSWDTERMPGDIAGSATSLYGEIARAGGDGTPRRDELLVAVLQRFERLCELIGDARGRAEVVADAARRSTILGRRVVVTLTAGRTVEGGVAGLAPSGALIVDSDDGRVEIVAGDVELVRST